MEFTIGLFAGLLLWPWWALGIFTLMCLVDAVLVENENASFGTLMMLIGTGLLIWLAGDANPFTLVWNNIGSIIMFFIVYFIVGGLWSIAKWYLYLIKVRDKMKKRGETTRPYESYARNNQGRIAAWIGHWPFSMIGFLFGEFLACIVNSTYVFLSNLYANLANSVFKDFDSVIERERRL